MKVLYNGDFVEKKDAHVDIEDRGYQFGDGVYEVIRVYNGTLFTLKEHTERLFKSAKEIGIHLQGTVSDMEEKLQQLVAHNQLTDGGVYIQVTRGVAPRKHQYSHSLTPQITAYTFQVKKPVQEQKAGAKAILSEDLRWLRCDIKSLNLLYNVMEKQKASEAGAFEAILIRDGFVTEGTASNVYAVIDGVIRTHPANNLILNGITRRKLLEVCEAEGCTVEETRISKEELLRAQEIFISSTTAEVIPIVEIDGEPVGEGVPGELTKRVQEGFQQKIKHESEASISS
ncbi:D-amino-acid transaminase [Bacillus safensis]|uniref:D-amino-acid transaminase n=1 Tax=Bacillus safensis TaxID=561879 RepID=A0AC61ZXA3_BACIA|nr:D-amino-acid transaminase [Bacillus safensis]MCY7676661.1 D-amino-acid transaminase [Bacillus safensis]MCY7700166.1 D-amino-acid transaminase [Bacillus safensis]MEC3627912.1 D-amino-acid transaminase [Bacillus safensis]USD83725.1 D-amino-acid transaminase [Bacillus safensis]